MAGQRLALCLSDGVYFATLVCADERFATVSIDGIGVCVFELGVLAQRVEDA